MMMYINLIWAWGHPEVYILVLPVFGVFSEIAATFSRKRLFGYTLWYGQPSVLPFCRSSFGCTTSSPWVLART